jgi:hypothetical protein
MHDLEMEMELVQMQLLEERFPTTQLVQEGNVLVGMNISESNNQKLLLHYQKIILL